VFFGIPGKNRNDKFWLIANCYLLIAETYLPDPAAIFFTMASTSLRSLSLRLMV